MTSLREIEREEEEERDDKEEVTKMNGKENQDL